MIRNAKLRNSDPRTELIHFYKCFFYIPSLVENELQGGKSGFRLSEIRRQSRGYSRYLHDTYDTLQILRIWYPLVPGRILWILWISTVSSGFSGFPMYRSDPHRIPDMRIWKGFSDPEYGGDPEDTSRIQRIRRIRWDPEDTEIPGSAFSPLMSSLQVI